MPNRILKESICLSDNLDQVSWFDEVLFYRLIVNCDDYGRFDGRITVLKSRLFPLKNDLTHRTVKEAVNRLVSAGLVVLYLHDGKPYLYLPTWNDHQNVRAKKSKYPEPPSKSTCKLMYADDFTVCGEEQIVENSVENLLKDVENSTESTCMQMYADENKCPRNPIQSVSESNPYPNPNPDTRAPARDPDGLTEKTDCDDDFERKRQESLAKLAAARDRARQLFGENTP